MKGAAEAELHQFFPILVIIEVNECYWLIYDPLPVFITAVEASSHA
jgi:hypothetical protein